jgi:hypothetical protein
MRVWTSMEHGARFYETTRNIVNRCERIIAEDLKIQNMQGDGCLSKGIAVAGARARFDFNDMGLGLCLAARQSI